jgi:DNA-binding SARP family transcriptional activator
MDMPSDIAELIESSVILEQAGQISQAFAQAKGALDLARTLDQPEVLAAAYIGLATLHFRTGHYAEARTLAADVLQASPRDSNQYADALVVLGNCAAETHSLVEAEDFFHQAADVSRESGYKLAQLRALHGLGQGVYMPRGQFDLALAAEQEVQRIAQEQNWPNWLPFPLTTLAWVYQLTGQPKLAHAALNALSAVIMPNSLHQGYYDYLSACVARDKDNFDTAAPLLIQARSIAETIGEPGLGVLARLGLSRNERATGNLPAAHQWADDAYAQATRSGYQHLQGMSLIERARAAWLLDDVSAAEADLRRAIDVMTPLETNFDLARAYLLLAALLHQSPTRRAPGVEYRAEREHDEVRSKSARPSTSPLRGPTQDAKIIWLDAVSRIVSGGYAFLLEQERTLVFPLLASYLGDESPDVAALSATLLNHLSRVPPPPLNITTLGKFEVEQRGRPIDKSAWHQRKAGELFRLLLITPQHALTREQVIEALWPDKSIGQAQPLFHRATSQLRRVLEPDLPDKFPSRYLEVDEGRVTLHLPIDTTIDLETFEQAVCDERWSDALAIYHGDLFPADRYADWAAAPRERLTQLYVRVLLIQAQLHFEAGAFNSTLDLCRRVLAIEPWHEPAALLAMQTYLAQNDRSNALKVYRALEQTLRDELNIAPLPELRRLAQSLLTL